MIIDCMTPHDTPDGKVHGANMRPTWVLWSPGGPHVGPMNLALWQCSMYLPPAVVIHQYETIKAHLEMNAIKWVNEHFVILDLF